MRSRSHLHKHWAAERSLLFYLDLDAGVNSEFRQISKNLGVLIGDVKHSNLRSIFERGQGFAGDCGNGTALIWYGIPVRTRFRVTENLFHSRRKAITNGMF